MTVPTLIVTAPTAAAQSAREWRGSDGRLYCRRGHGTVGIEALVMTVEAGIQEWYLDPLQQNRSLLTAPYIYPVEGKDVMMVTASAPIRRDGKAVGIATTDLALTDLQRQFASMHPLGAGDVRLLAQNNHWVVHPQTAELNRPVATPGLSALISSVSPGQPAMDTMELDGQERLVLAYSIRFAGVPEHWTLLVTLPTQVITDAHNFEGWTNFPKERDRLYALLGQKGVNNAIFLTGDRHSGGFYKTNAPGLSKPLWDFTSSSLNLAFGKGDGGDREPDPSRTGGFWGIPNFGQIDIDWAAKKVVMTLRKDDGSVIETQVANAID